MKEITPVAGSTNFSSILCLKNFYFATLWQSAVLGAFKCQSVLASPKINRKKCYGWNAIYRNEFGDFSSVFGRIWHVDYVCYMNKAGIQMYVTLISTQASTYFIPIILRYAKKKKRSKWKKHNKTKQTILLYFHVPAQQVWRHPMKNLEWYIWKQKRKKGILLPSWYSYWG